MSEYFVDQLPGHAGCLRLLDGIARCLNRRFRRQQQQRARKTDNRQRYERLDE